MRVLLFTIVGCIGCDGHRRDVEKMCARLMVSLNVYNIDDPRYFQMSLHAMRKYGVRKTPSIVVLNEVGEIVATIQGIRHTLEKLETLINEKRSND